MPRQPKPPPVKLWELRFPGMGVIRRQSYERQQAAVDYPTPWAVNCRLEDALSSRLRGGSWTPIAAGARPDAVYRDRALTFDANAISASRVGDHDDFTYSADVSDLLRPRVFQLSEGGEIGEDVVALVPHKDAFLLGATAGELWVLSGDPNTGTLRNVSRNVGMVTEDAWCKDGDAVYFLSSHGLHVVGADGSGLKALSSETIPEELTGVTDVGTTLTYNHADGGVYIHLPNSAVSWFYDTDRNGFWPFKTGTAESHVLIGPLRLGGPDDNGLVQMLHGIMAAGSTTVHWRIVLGDTAEAAATDGKAAITADLAGTDYDQYVAASGSWSAGRSKTSWPRVRGMWACIWLSSAGTWAFEELHMTTIPMGRYR